MKILMIALFDTKACGPTEVIKKIVPELIKLGNSVDILSPYSFDKEKAELASELGMKYFYSDQMIFSQKELKQSVPNINEYGIFHFHGIYEYRNWALAKLANKMKIPYVYTIHGNLMTYAIKKSKIKNLRRKFL